MPSIQLREKKRTAGGTERWESLQLGARGWWTRGASNRSESVGESDGSGSERGEREGEKRG